MLYLHTKARCGWARIDEWAGATVRTKKKPDAHLIMADHYSFTQAAPVVSHTTPAGMRAHAHVPPR